MDAISDPRVSRVVLMASAQVGKTEIANNAIGFFIDQDPSPLLVVQPTVEMAESWSKDRLSPMLRDTPALRGKVAEARSRDSGNTLLHKRFNGGHVTIVGANAPSGLASRPIRVVVADEVDRYPVSAGTEGDPVSLAIKRTATFWNRKVVLLSTPTVRGASRIEEAYEESDQRIYLAPCPACGHEQRLVWPQVRWPEGQPARARYHCIECDEPWGDGARWSAIRRGRWEARAPEALSAGFHLSELYSSWRTLADMALDFQAARQNPERLRTFVNTSLGETWQEASDAPEWERLYERREAWAPGAVPAGGLFLTAGADVQKDRIEVDVWAWGRGLRSWLVDHVVIRGGPDRPESWAALDELLGRTWEHEHGARLGLGRLGIDTGFQGYEPAETQVYSYVRRAGGMVSALKGEKGLNRANPVSGPTYVDVSEGGRRRRRGVMLWTVATSVFKAEFYRQLRQPRATDDELEAGLEHPPGSVHLPTWVDVEWIKQLVSEELRTIRPKKGAARLEWHKVRERNEALDCRVYARAAAWIAEMDRWPESTWRDLERQAAPAGAPAHEDVAAKPSAGRLRKQRRSRPAVRPDYL